VSPLPAGREETPRRLAEDLGEDTLTVLERTSSVFGIQAVHLVALLGNPRGRSPASLTSMEVAVKKKLL
jgi:hypothetical protein